jgi:hypothetical protein
MRALSIRQPWASLIVAGCKDVENRTWRTSVRGRILVHAGLALDRAGLEFAAKLGIEIDPATLDRGGVIGSVEIVDCVDYSESPWFFGPFGFLLRSPQRLPFRPCPGKLGFFEPAQR